MAYPILGLHHVTATVNEPQADLDFGVGALGLRLVKKTVNFDNHDVYHFYYGDEVGTPGTIWTTFPYAGRGVPRGVHGAGQITVTSFSVPTASLATWTMRLRGRGLSVSEGPARFGEESILVADSSGLTMELVGSDRDIRAPWVSPAADAATAVRGLHSVTLTVRDPRPTISLLSDILGFTIANEMEGRIRVSVNGDGPGKTLDIVHDREVSAARNGIGTVHHVAVAIDGVAEQLRLREELVRRGLQVTPVMDRQYFRSIYFREPGGVLLEVATVQPGFAIDESVGELGRGLKLPPWEEPSRAEIEAALPPVSVG